MNVKLSVIFLFITLNSCKIEPDLGKSKACFDYSPTSNLTSSTSVSFSNCSLNANAYIWDFGDRQTSTDKTTKHQFKAGTYKVRLLSQIGELKDINQDGKIDFWDSNTTSDTTSKYLIIGK